MKSLNQVILETSTSNISANRSINGFVILKPGFTKYKDQLLTLLKNDNWQPIQIEELTLSDKQVKELYSPHKGKDFYNDLCSYMTSGEIIAISLYKECSDPIGDMNKIKDKVRTVWGNNDEMKNVMHSSDSLENVERESKILFQYRQ